MESVGDIAKEFDLDVPSEPEPHQIIVRSEEGVSSEDELVNNPEFEQKIIGESDPLSSVNVDRQDDSIEAIGSTSE